MAQTHIYPTDLELQSGTMNVLLGPTSVWEDVIDAPDGGA